MMSSPLMDAEPTPTRLPAGSGQVAIPGAGGVRRLLVVDDEVQVRSLVKALGRHFGWEVHEAVNGAEALALLQQPDGGIELMLTDVTMPVMDGLELVQAAKVLPVPPAIAVMSGRLDAGLRTALAAEGVTHFLAKPFSVEELRLALLRLQPRGR